MLKWQRVVYVTLVPKSYCLYHASSTVRIVILWFCFILVILSKMHLLSFDAQRAVVLSRTEITLGVAVQFWLSFCTY